MTIHAIYENGVFRPLEKVDLPEQTHVAFEPVPIAAPGAGDEAGLDNIYAVLSRRYQSGDMEGASRHNGHQP